MTATLAALLTVGAVLLWPQRESVPGRELRALLSGGDGNDGALPPLAATTSDDVASSMTLLAVALQSGCGVVEAMEEVAAVAPPAAGRDLAVVSAALRWGVTDTTAWYSVDPLWSRAATALRLARQAGVAPSSLLRAGADDIRIQDLAELEVAAERVGVRMVLPLGFAFLPAFVMTTVVPVVLALVRTVLSP